MPDRELLDRIWSSLFAARHKIRGQAPARLLNDPDGDSLWFNWASDPPPAYPAPSAAAIDVLAFRVPFGSDGIIQALAITHIGGGIIDGSGNVVWQVRVNGAAVRNMGNLQSQLGTMAQPLPTFIPIYEGDVVEVTVQVPAGQPALPPGETTSALAMGYYFAKQRTYK